MRFRCSNVDPPPNFKILSSYPLTFHTNAWFVCTQKPHCSSPCFKLLLSVQNEKEKKREWILYQNNSQVKVRLSVLMLNGPYSLSLYRFTKQKGTRNIIAPKRFIRQFASTHLHSWADVGTVEKKKVFGPRTQHNDLRKSWTQTSQRVSQSAIRWLWKNNEGTLKFPKCKTSHWADTQNYKSVWVLQYTIQQSNYVTASKLNCVLANLSVGGINMSLTWGIGRYGSKFFSVLLASWCSRKMS